MSSSKPLEHTRRRFDFFWPIVGALLAFFGVESLLSLNNIWTTTQAHSAEAIAAILLGIFLIAAAVKAQR